MTDAKTVYLDTLADGAAKDLFANALEKVLTNIEDPNTPAKKKRRVTLHFDFTVDEERRVGGCEITCDMKLPGVKGVSTGLYYGQRLGALTVVEAPRQNDMFTEPNRPAPRAVEPVKGTGA
jgi:hypothetical protein